MEVIEVKAFLADIQTEITNLSLNGLKGTPRPIDNLLDLESRIKEQPSFQADPVIEAEWIFNADAWTWDCTNCKGWIGSASRLYRRRPHCGAYMKRNTLGAEPYDPRFGTADPKEADKHGNT